LRRNEPFYEFRCNIDDKGKLDSPIALMWEPTFSYLDEKKNDQGIVFSANYYPTEKKVGIVNYSSAMNLFYRISEKNTFPVNFGLYIKSKDLSRDQFSQILECCIFANRYALKSNSNPIHLEYRLIKDPNESFFDISMRILKPEEIQSASLKNQSKEIEFSDGQFRGKRLTSYYFFIIGEDGNLFLVSYNKGMSKSNALNQKSHMFLLFLSSSK
jgi:hypothetical protein